MASTFLKLPEFVAIFLLLSATPKHRSTMSVSACVVRLAVPKSTNNNKQNKKITIRKKERRDPNVRVGKRIYEK